MRAVRQEQTARSGRLESLDEAVRRAYRELGEARFEGSDESRLRALTDETIEAHNNWREERLRSQGGGH
jgi:Spy/CpxP family protein refolding chaperone